MRTVAAATPSSHNPSGTLVITFRHFGHCDHTAVISGVERRRGGSGTTEEEDEEDGVVTYLRRPRALYCDVCSSKTATIVAYGCRYCPAHPTIFCKLCFEDYKELGADSFLAFALWDCFRRSSAATQLVDGSTA